jgi:hypothetical protein
MQHRGLGEKSFRAMLISEPCESGLRPIPKPLCSGRPSSLLAIWEEVTLLCRHRCNQSLRD